eukprot:380010-Prorocentrum_minimum.AAC.3
MEGNLPRPFSSMEGYAGSSSTGHPEKTSPRSIQMDLERSFHEALAVKKRMQDSGEWPGIYAKEMAVTNSIMTKIYASTAAAGLVMHFGLRRLIPRQGLGVLNLNWVRVPRAVTKFSHGAVWSSMEQWMLRTGLVGVSVFNSFWASGAFWALAGMKDLLALEHSLCAQALCPMALSLHRLKQQPLGSSSLV